MGTGEEHQRGIRTITRVLSGQRPGAVVLQRVLLESPSNVQVDVNGGVKKSLETFISTQSYSVSGHVGQEGGIEGNLCLPYVELQEELCK